MSRPPLNVRLAYAGNRRRDAISERRIAAQLLREAIHEAADDGWPKNRIAEIAGISRQTVHEILKGER